MLTDVIAALATPPGRSAVALIRLSGDGAHDVAARALTPFHSTPPRTARRARVLAPFSGEVIDEVLYVVFAAPASYTGQDLVEISTHGGLLVPVEVLGALLASGARQAGPGEFTRRAVLNGKMDLLQAEAVGDLVDATAPAQRRAALSQLDRGLSRRIDVLRSKVLDLEAMVSYDIDFPDEDSGLVPVGRIDQAILDLETSFRSLLGTADEGERLREGALAVIAGRPNTGKSSLFNALLGTERAIVTEVPGTTRDAVEAPAICNGFPFRLIDTAGLRTTDDRLERLGVEVSRRYLDSADVVLFCAEAGRRLDASELAFVHGVAAPAVLVRTKVDLAAGSADSSDEDGGIEVSALTGDGLERLRIELASFAFANLAGRADLDPLITRARHRASLERALAEIEAFRDARSSGLEAAVGAVHLRTAVDEIEDVIGVVTREDVFERVFSTFCVGK